MYRDGKEERGGGTGRRNGKEEWEGGTGRRSKDEDRGRTGQRKDWTERQDRGQEIKQIRDKRNDRLSLICLYGFGLEFPSEG